jgi:hypothetical protein
MRVLGSKKQETVDLVLCISIKSALTLVIKSGDSLPPTISRRVWGLAEPMSNETGEYSFNRSKRTCTRIIGI